MENILIEQNKLKNHSTPTQRSDISRMFDMDRWKVLQLVAIFSTLHIISEEIPEPQGNDFLRVDNCGKGLLIVISNLKAYDTL